MTSSKKGYQLEKEDIKLLNSNKGLRLLLEGKKPEVEKVLIELKEQKRIEELRIKLVQVQDWVRQNNKKLIIIFEGRDAAGKGGTIKGMTSFINPRHYKTVALPKPSSDQKGEWYFKRYVEKLPRPGEIVFFDRSWYNRAVVEPVHGFCTKKDYDTFMGQVNEFERMLIESDNLIIKFFLTITKEEQAKRLADIKTNPLKKWRMTAVDAKAQSLWNDYSKYEKLMFDQTNTQLAPWVLIDGENRNHSLIDTLEYIISKTPIDK